MEKSRLSKVRWSQKFGNKIGIMLILFALIPSIFLVIYITNATQKNSKKNEEQVVTLIESINQDYLNQINEYNSLIQNQLNQYNDYLSNQITNIEEQFSVMLEKNYTDSFDDSLETLSLVFINFIETQKNSLEKSGKTIASIPGVQEKTASKSISLIERYSLLDPYVTSQQFNGMQLWIMDTPDTRGSGLEISKQLERSRKVIDEQVNQSASISEEAEELNELATEL